MTRRAFIPSLLLGAVPPFLMPQEPKRDETPPSPDARKCILGHSDMEAWYVQQGARAEFASLDCLYTRAFGGGLEPCEGAVLVRIT